MTGVDATCRSGVLNRSPTSLGGQQAFEDEHDRVWIPDVDGVHLVIDVFSFPGASAADHAEIQEIVDSIRIE